MAEDIAIIFLYSLISVIIVSLISLIGVLFLSLNLKKLKKVILFLVSFSAGALLGDTFIHLLPEAVKESGFSLSVSFYILLGIFMFFIIEKVVHWQHCHEPASKNHTHPFAFMNLVGDALHNFIDGLVIGASYLVNIQVGIATTVAVLIHEVPQEVSDFGVLLHGGFTKTKALLFNFLSASAAIFGTILSVLIGLNLENFEVTLISLTAGGFIYIAASDLIPELHKETKVPLSAMQILGILLGFIVMFGLLLVE